jgi:hypothetical protein
MCWVLFVCIHVFNGLGIHDILRENYPAQLIYYDSFYSPLNHENPKKICPARDSEETF